MNSRNAGSDQFTAWVKRIFDRSVDNWHGDFDPFRGIDDPSPSASVGYLTELFTHADTLLADFTDEQVNLGLWELVDEGSWYAHALLEDAVPWPARRDGLEAIGVLYERFFATRCTPHLSHLDEPGANAINSVCYMWWDIFPTWGRPNDPSHAKIDSTLLGVMERALAIDSIACQESALHGLGHWHLDYPKRTEQVIATFLQTHAGLRRELGHYARWAARGYVQ